MDSCAVTEVVHVRRDALRVSGELTVQGADLVRGTVENLVRGGSRRVVVDLRQVRSTDAGLRVLRDVERTMAADGAELVVRPPEDRTTEPTRPRVPRDLGTWPLSWSRSRR
ncbi:STAS domain-containing protein [Trujillonella humicola]|uniref:STAS domain-containing protein n=1 Tax=Trujillonella humicola TaxID=3383699 RepID=UPI0039065377